MNKLKSVTLIAILNQVAKILLLVLKRKLLLQKNQTTTTPLQLINQKIRKQLKPKLPKIQKVSKIAKWRIVKSIFLSLLDVVIWSIIRECYLKTLMRRLLNISLASQSISLAIMAITAHKLQTHNSNLLDLTLKRCVLFQLVVSVNSVSVKI